MQFYGLDNMAAILQIKSSDAFTCINILKAIPLKLWLWYQLSLLIYFGIFSKGRASTYSQT